MNYAPRPYYRTSLNRKRQIIDHMVDFLHEQQLDMIDEAVKYSDLAKAKEIIDYIKNL